MFLQLLTDDLLRMRLEALDVAERMNGGETDEYDSLSDSASLPDIVVSWTVGLWPVSSGHCSGLCRSGQGHVDMYLL